MNVMMGWLNSLPPWLYWLVLSPFIVLGLGLFWIIMIQLNTYPGDPDVELKMGEHFKEFGVLRGLLLLVSGLAYLGIGLSAACALFFLPSPLYRYVLGWSWDNAILAGPFTTFAVMGLLWGWSCWDDRRKEKGEFESKNGED